MSLIETLSSALSPYYLILSFSEESYLPFHHSLMLDLLLETLLGFKTGIEQGRSVHIPLADAIEVFRAVLIINDEWHDLVAQTLFEHQQPSKAAIAIGKKVDALEMNIIV